MNDYVKGLKHAAYAVAGVLTLVAAASPNFPVFVLAAVLLGVFGALFYFSVNI